MSAESEADRAAFLDEDEFGGTATVTPAGGVAREISAILTRRTDILLDTSYPEPRLIARTSDVSDLADGDPIVVAGTTYTARTFEPDGTGMTAIRLEKP